MFFQHRTRLLSLLPSVLVAAIATWAIWTNSLHRLLNGRGMFPVYADLRSVTATADCILTDPSWSVASPTCDPFGREYNYPSFWAKSFALVRLGESRTEEIAVLMAGLLVLAFAIICLLTTPRAKPGFAIFVSTASLLAPPTWLAIERANIDILIFVILTIGVLLFLRGHIVVSAIVLGVDSVLKIFPIGAFLLFLSHRRKHPFPALLFLAIAGLGFAFLLPQFSTISSRTPQSPGNSFGAPLLFVGASEVFGLEVGTYVPRVLGLTVVITAVTIFFAAEYKIPKLSKLTTDTVSSIASDRIALALILPFGGSFAAAYLSGTNFDYRLIFLVPVAVGLAHACSFSGRLGRVLATTFALQSWLTFPTPVWVQVASDIAWTAIFPIFLLLLLRVTGETQSRLHSA